jgi:NAD-dependent SIR2 family protein deacetylase
MSAATPIGRTMVLLGAGASVEAGVPASKDMTIRLVDLLNAPSGTPRARALNYLVSALQHHEAGQGARPDAGVDVERVFDAVQALANPETIEVTPFVASWAGALESISASAHLPEWFGPAFAVMAREADAKSSAELTKLFEEAVAVLTGRVPTASIFSQLSDAMTTALRQLLFVNRSRVGYLEPLLRFAQTHAEAGPFTIATLNYDRSVEELCSHDAGLLDTGISRWQGGHDWSWRGASPIRLLKLHGSIDWCMERQKTENKLDHDEIHQTTDPTNERRTPVIVFGKRGKVRADGPFLAMLRAFDTALSESDHLLIVGYSFRDDHINVALRRWLNGADHRDVTVIDPHFVEETGPLRTGRFFRRAPFERELWETLGPGDGVTTRPIRFRAIVKPAAAGLREWVDAPD